MLTRFVATLALLLLSDSAAALDWGYAGSGFYLGMTEGGSDFSSKNGVDGRIVVFKVNRYPSREKNQPFCYELEFAENQEGVLYCGKAKGSSLSESLFARTPTRGDHKTFICVKNCRAGTPKVLRLKYDEPD